MQVLILDIITTAAILFAVACGLLISFGVLKIINFAHGAFLTIGGYSALVITQLGLNPLIAYPFALLVGLVLGAAVERFVVKPLYGRPLDAILATWGLGIIISQLITIAFGRGVQFVASPVTGTAELFDGAYSVYRLAATGGALFIGVLLALLMHRTRLGLNARAVIMNENLAQALGINSAVVRLIAFGLGAGLASLAGAIITPLSSVDPNMGVPWLVNAFMLVLVSGSSLGALAVASVVLGGLQLVISTYGSPILGGLTIAVAAALLLRIRPKGFAFD